MSLLCPREASSHPCSHPTVEETNSLWASHLCKTTRSVHGPVWAGLKVSCSQWSLFCLQPLSHACVPVFHHLPGSYLSPPPGRLTVCLSLLLQIERQLFEETVKTLNGFYADAEKIGGSSYLEGCLACATAYFIFLCMETHYEKVLLPRLPFPSFLATD